MRITIDRDHLRDGLKKVGGAVATRSYLPVLGMVLVHAGDEGLRLSSTNLEMALTTLCPDCQVDEIGTVAVPFKDLSDLLAKLPAGTVHFSTTDPHPAPSAESETEAETEAEAQPETESEAGATEAEAEPTPARVPPPPDTLYITATDVEGRLVGLPATEFPALSFEPADPTVIASWDASDFVRHVESVSFAAATDGSRPTLQGIFFQVAHDSCRLVTADGYRLAALGRPLAPFQRTFSPPQIFAQQGSSPAPTAPAQPDPWIQAILPAVCLPAFTRSLDDGQVTMMRGNEPNWLFHADGTSFLVREIEGNFPDYTQILPASPPPLTVTVSRAALAKFLDLSVLYARHSALLVYVEIRENALTLLANAEIGSSDSDVPITTHVAGSAISLPFLFGVNGRYLAEAVRAAASMNAEGDTVEIRLWDANRPIVVTPANAGATPLTIVQMPMHITR